MVSMGCPAEVTHRIARVRHTGRLMFTSTTGRRLSTFGSTITAHELGHALDSCP